LVGGKEEGKGGEGKDTERDEVGETGEGEGERFRERSRAGTAAGMWSLGVSCWREGGRGRKRKNERGEISGGKAVVILSLSLSFARSLSRSLSMHVS
jgi:hypothetical protein